MPKKKSRGKRPSQPADSRRTAPDPASQSGRYTPATPNYRLRPKWHRLAGWLGVAAGVLIALVNDAQFFAEDLRLLPGGHQELYLLLAIGVAGASTWFLGLFDRGTTVFD